jgi:8-oxo-dGTP diphosphatase
LITLRVMAGAFLMNGNDFLLMKRSPEKQFYPGLWASVGGHAEPGEINDPQAACLREINEETGISEKELSGLALRYIVLRRAKDEIRVSYVYFGEANTRSVIGNDEGELHWIGRDELLDRPMSAMNELILERYLAVGPEKDVMVGALTKQSGEAEIGWLPLSAWEGL